MDFKIWGFMFLLVVSILFRILPSDATWIQERDLGGHKGKEMAAPRGLSTNGRSTANKRIPAVIRPEGAVGGRGGGGRGRSRGGHARGEAILGGAGRTHSSCHNRGNKALAVPPYLCLAFSVILMFNFLI